jgi:hypothetical protein
MLLYFEYCESLVKEDLKRQHSESSVKFNTSFLFKQLKF